MNLLSIIVIIHNDAERIDLFYHQIVQNLKNMDSNYECIFVDNGSHDNTLDKLKYICNNDFHFHYISLKHNITIPHAYYIGLYYAHGDYIQFMELHHPVYMINECYKTMLVKELNSVQGLLQEGTQLSKKQLYFKLFNNKVLIPYLEDEDFDGFKACLKHPPEPTFLISYSNLEKDELSKTKRLLHFLNHRYELRMIYLILLLIFILMIGLPSLLILIFHLDVAYTYIISSLITVSILFIMEALHATICSYATPHQSVRIREITFH